MGILVQNQENKQNYGASNDLLPKIFSKKPCLCLKKEGFCVNFKN
jgi:hypothetical protein